MTLPQSISEIILPESLERKSIGESRSDVFEVQLTNQKRAYLKISSSRYDADELRQENKILHWLKARLPVPVPIMEVNDSGKIHSLVSALLGENLAEAAKGMTADECLIAGTRFLREWHSLPIADCPFDRRLYVALKAARQNIEAGLVDEADFDVESSGRTAQELYAELLGEVPQTEDLVFTHGDFCLPNLIFNRGTIVGAIDLGRAGIADRNQDIALFLRSFQSNVGRPDLDLFLQEYHLFQKLDSKKLAFYRILDEFF